MGEAEIRVQAESGCEVSSLAAVYLDEDGREIRKVVVYRGPREHQLEDMHVILREALLARAASIRLLRKPAPNPRDLFPAEVLALHRLGVAAGTAGISPITFSAGRPMDAKLRLCSEGNGVGKGRPRERKESSMPNAWVCRLRAGMGG